MWRAGPRLCVAALGAATLCLVACGCVVACGSVVAPAFAARRGATSYYRLVQYPGAGFRGFYRQVARARRTIDMEMYELEDPTAERALVAAAGRGVRVRVLLDSAFNGASANRGTVRYLGAHGVQVRWAPSGYIYHIKATTFDTRVADISTANLVARYYPSTRDAEIIDTNPPQVRAIERTFANDWAAGRSGDPAAQTVQALGLVWSPNTGTGTAQDALVKQITAARRSVDFESEELSDTAVYQALAAAARRGVSCRVVMTNSAEWDPAFRAITQAGCQVHLFPDRAHALYIHEKEILADARAPRESLLIGSQNASVTSLTRDRELSVVLARSHGGSRVIAQAAATFNADFKHATRWSPPAPGQAPTPQPAPTTLTGCHPQSVSGNCYRAGEYCSSADHGLTGVAADGDAIVCEDSDGWRWEAQ